MRSRYFIFSSDMRLRHFIRLFLTGMSISFIGTLPLGTLNVSAMQISVSDGMKPAFLFAIGAMLVEITYVRISLSAMDWVRRHDRLFRWLERGTLLIIAALAVASFVAASRPSGTEKHAILSASMPRFLLGMLMSAVNPLQIPFWFGWSSVLFTRGILGTGPVDRNIYISGIGIGTCIGFAVFILGGQWVAERIGDNQRVVHIIVGSLFALTAILMAGKMMRKGKTGTHASGPSGGAH